MKIIVTKIHKTLGKKLFYPFEETKKNNQNFTKLPISWQKIVFYNETRIPNSIVFYIVLFLQITPVCIMFSCWEFMKFSNNHMHERPSYN